jgi:hypothetical protein
MIAKKLEKKFALSNARAKKHTIFRKKEDLWEMSPEM